MSKCRNCLLVTVSLPCQLLTGVIQRSSACAPASRNGDTGAKAAPATDPLKLAQELFKTCRTSSWKSVCNGQYDKSSDINRTPRPSREQRNMSATSWTWRAGRRTARFGIMAKTLGCESTDDKAAAQAARLELYSDYAIGLYVEGGQTRAGRGRRRQGSYSRKSPHIDVQPVLEIRELEEGIVPFGRYTVTTPLLRLERNRSDGVLMVGTTPWR